MCRFGTLGAESVRDYPGYLPDPALLAAFSGSMEVDGRARGRARQTMRHSISQPDVARRLKALSGRDLQLWSIGFMVMMVLASAVASIILPNTATTFYLQPRYLPQLALGLIALVLLLNFYLIEKRRALDRERQQMVAQL